MDLNHAAFITQLNPIIMNRYSKVFTLLKKINKHQDSEYRIELCLAVTKGRTETLTELRDVELNELCTHLRTVSASFEHKTFDDMSAEKMRKKLFSIFRDLGWYINDKPNYPKITNWILKYGYLHKPIMKYSNKELPQLITQAETIQKKDYEKNIH